MMVEKQSADADAPADRFAIKLSDWLFDVGPRFAVFVVQREF